MTREEAGNDHHGCAGVGGGAGVSQLVLSLFPGADLLGRWFHEEGFCIVRGPDLIFGEDVREFSPPPGRFDGVIGGPPCQKFSPLRWSFLTRDGRPLVVELAALESPRYTPAVCASGSTWVPVRRIGGSGKPKPGTGRVAGIKSRRYLDAAIEAQGLPADFLAEAPWTVTGKIRVVGNGVPRAMGRALARAVKAALGHREATA